MPRPLKKNLVYTIAFDAPDSEGYRFLGKMLASSLLKTFFTGDVLIFRNSPAPLFLVERKGLEEVYIETPQIEGQEGAEDAWCWKHRVAELIENPEQYDKILFLDCDSLALRNIDHLLEGDWDIAFQPERGKPVIGRSFNAFLTDEEMVLESSAGKVDGGRGSLAERSGEGGSIKGSLLQAADGANSGTLAVRGAIFHQVMEAWRDIDESEPLRASGFRDQASWNALLVRMTDRLARAGVEGGGCSDAASPHPTGMKSENLNLSASLWHAVPFPAGEVQFPGYLDPHYASYSKAALTHNIMADTLEKIQFTFGLYMRTFYCDPTGLFFSMLEI